MHHVTWRVFLYLVMVVTNERDTSRTGGLTEKNILSVYFVSAVKKKCQCREALLCSWCLCRSLEYFLKPVFGWIQSV